MNALRSKLTWTHYRLLLKVEKDSAREFYIDEAVTGNWSTRQLERQINSLFYDRTLMSRDKKGMIMDGRALQDKMQPEDIINRLTTFNINTRYDSYKDEFKELCTSEFAEEWKIKIEKLREWLKAQL